jgi:hypothetical protein
MCLKSVDTVPDIASSRVVLDARSDAPGVYEGRPMSIVCEELEAVYTMGDSDLTSMR